MAKITIFGLAGTGTSSTGKALARALDVPFMSSGNMFRQEAALRGMTMMEFHVLAESDASYDVLLDNQIKEYGIAHKDFVIESRLAWYFVPDSYKVKLVCDHDERLRRVARRDNMSFEQAREDTKMRETMELKKYRELYGIDDYTADSHFDLILDTTNTPLHKIVEAIEEKIKTV